MSPSEIYRPYGDNNADIDVKEEFNKAVSELELLTMINTDRLKYSDEIKKIYLLEEAVPSIYDFLQIEYGITPREIDKQKVMILLETYDSTVHTEDDVSVAGFYCRFVRQQVEKDSFEINYSRIEANLKMLAFLQKNEEEIYAREASMLVYGDSKWFQENNYEEICTILREAADAPKNDNEPSDMILEVFHVMPNEQDIFLKGRWKIRLHDTVIDTRELRCGISVSSADIADIESITVEAPVLMTVENKTSFQRMQAKDTSYLYLGGFATRFQIEFIKKVIAENPQISYMHFGDIDAGGFFIHKNLCEATGKGFQLYAMGREQLKDKRFALCLKPLTNSDNARLQVIASMEPYKEVVSYMLEHNVKLEQEIVSYYETRNE
ncbi:MAG: Wadjet anti-phage system protein JetD domain-containing protein [Anaerovoracaceae bacterium]